MSRTCKHTEGLIEEMGKPSYRLPCDVHDCAYVDARNALIPEAEKIADQMLRDLNAGRSLALQLTPGSVAYKSEWSRRFMAAMDFLWASRDTRSQAEAA